MLMAMAAMAAMVVLVSGVALAKVVEGTNAGETLTGTINPDLIKALAGNDTYYGGSGVDYLTDWAGVTTPPTTGEGYTGVDVMYGGGGDDVMEGARGTDELHGGPNPTLYEEILFGDSGNDKLYGEGGPDHLEGNAGSDLMSGGDDGDYIDARTFETVGTPDTVNCGGGEDTVTANDNDIVASDCEEVNRVANPLPPA